MRRIGNNWFNPEDIILVTEQENVLKPDGTVGRSLYVELARNGRTVVITLHTEGEIEEILSLIKEEA